MGQCGLAWRIAQPREDFVQLKPRETSYRAHLQMLVHAFESVRELCKDHCGIVGINSRRKQV